MTGCMDLKGLSDYSGIPRRTLADLLITNWLPRCGNAKTFSNLADSSSPTRRKLGQPRHLSDSSEAVR